MATSENPATQTSASQIRPVSAADTPALKAVIAATDLFPAELLDDMMAPYLAVDAPDELWLTAVQRDPIAVAYCAPERMTQGTWNLYLLAVHPAAQGQGHGAALVRSIEAALVARGHRILLVETSGLPEFEGARAFYRKSGFSEEARIREFYQPGNDKVIFRKALISGPTRLPRTGDRGDVSDGGVAE